MICVIVFLTRRRFDIAVRNVGIGQGHGNLPLTKDPRHGRKRHTVQDSLAGEVVTQIMKTHTRDTSPFAEVEPEWGSLGVGRHLGARRSQPPGRRRRSPLPERRTLRRQPVDPDAGNQGNRWWQFTRPMLAAWASADHQIHTSTP